MDTFQKLDILAADSQYDLACACGVKGGKDHRTRSADGRRWLYPVPLASGGSGIMFKTLQSNCCSNDCAYCPLRSDANARRCTMSPDETAEAFMEVTRRRWLLGMFLSSGVVGNADRTMERLTATADILRRRHRYRGYIHLKIIPGASKSAIDEALRLSSAVSLNIEVPGARHFEHVSSCKRFDSDIVEPLKYIAAMTSKGSRHAGVRTSTQFIVGASDETDREIVRYMDGLYNRLNFGRVYFSAYQRGLGDGRLPGERNFQLDPADALTREHRLYQADWLIRTYGFSPGELVFSGGGNFFLDRDPKEAWAEAHPECFPVDVNTASPEELIRIPGIGAVAAAKIVKNRGIHRLMSLDGLGIAGKLALRAARYCRF